MGIENKLNKYLNEASKKDELANLIRDHLSGTNRRVSKESLFALVKNSMKNVSINDFNKVIKELIDDGYVVRAGKGYFKWEM